jgi:hypothetical protein
LWLLILLTTAYLETRPKASAKLESTESKTAVAVVAELREQLARMEETHVALEKEKRQIEADRDGWQNAHQGRVEELRYGGAFIRVTEMTPNEHVAVRPQLEELQAAVDSVVARANDMWTEIGQRCQAHRPDLPPTDRNFRLAGTGHEQASLEDSSLAWLYGFVADRVAQPVGATMTLFRERLQNGHDPRSALAAFYARYRDWQTWIVRLAKMVRLESGWSGYKVWYEADQQFNAELQKKLLIKQLSDVRAAISGYNKEQSLENKPLPKPGAPW